MRPSTLSDGTKQGRGEGGLTGGGSVGGGAADRPNFSLRHSRRTALFAQRKKLSDYALLFSLLGLALMVLETELVMAGVYDKVWVICKRA